MNDLYATDTFEAFFAVYESMHSDPRTRLAHLAATTSAIALFTAGVARRSPALCLLAPIVDYAIAQTSHRLVEKNRTTPLRRPLWHARAELRLARRTLASLRSRQRSRNVSLSPTTQSIDQFVST